MTVTRVTSVGHGTLPAEEFAGLLVAADLQGVADVRSYPGSRRNPQYGRVEMERWMPPAGLSYRWIPALGGRRRPRPDSKHAALRHEAFRAYADHMGISDFGNGVEALLGLAGDERTAVMCSESVWWRCHRRLLADHLVLVEGIEVAHLMHDGRVVPHVLTDGVRVSEGALVYDVGTTSSLLS